MSTNRARRADTAGFVIAGLLLALALVIVWDLSNLRITSVYGLGPEAMPVVVAAGLVLLAAGNAAMAYKGELPAREPVDIRAIVLILGGLVALIALIGLGGGFIPATAILFAATATAFGRRAILVDLVIGLVLAVAVYLLFAKLLTLSLPVGLIERLI
ncbi:MAG: tripartite tricarboxylate transporter TctB family protein [Rhizobiales bacterium]|nr:tripartite tricarboxylate transporter TctB family protein [Hyphomicrobiales bacterium]